MHPQNFWKHDPKNISLSLFCQLVPSLIERISNNLLKQKGDDRTLDNAKDLVMECADELKNDVVGLYAEKLQIYKRRSGEKMETSEAFAAANEYVNSCWDSFESRVALAPGKEVFSKLNQKLTSTHGISLSVMSLSSNITKEEIDPEIQEILKEIEKI